jgi:hypothetical protein
MLQSAVPRSVAWYIGELLQSGQFYSVQIGGDFGKVGGRRADDFDLAACAQCDAHCGLMVLLHFGLNEEAGCVDLADPPGGVVVSIDGEVGVVEDDYCRLWHFIILNINQNKLWTANISTRLHFYMSVGLPATFR